jgi:hypothetical protein
MIRHLIVLMLALLWVAAQPATQPSTEPAPSPLDHVVDEIEFDHVRLIEAIEFLRDRTGVTIFVNYKMLERSGIDYATVINAPGNAAAADKSLRAVLASVLQSADPGGKAKLISRELDGMVEVTTADDINGAPPRRFAATPRGDPKQVAKTEAALHANVADAAHVQIDVNWDALRDLNITKDTPVSAQNPKTSVRRLLEIVLDCLSVAPENKAQKSLQYLIDGDHLIISTEADLAKK